MEAPEPRVHISAQRLTPCVTLGSHLPSEGLGLQMCKMGTVTPACQYRCEAAGDHSCEWGLYWAGWVCGCPRGLCLPICFVFSSSPFMSKFFPASFPNRQYQLLFTQGSGENKEGQCCPLPPPLPFVSPMSGLMDRASDGEVGSGSHCLPLGDSG